MTKAEKQVLKRVYLEFKEVKTFYWSMVQALEKKHSTCNADSPEQKRINHYYKLVENWSAKENIIKDLAKELARGQELKEYLGITTDDFTEIIERVNRHVDRQIAD